MIEIQKCLPRRQAGQSAVKCYSQGHNRMVVLEQIISINRFLKFSRLILNRQLCLLFSAISEISNTEAITVQKG